MPVIQETKGLHQLICDFCGLFAGKADDDWLKYSGYFYGNPKFSIFCPNCRKVFLSQFLDERDRVIDREERKVNMSTNTEKVNTTQSQPQSQTPTIQWETIDKLISDKNCRISILAKELQINPNDLKKMFEEHYGDKVEYRRGRAGGVFWKE